MVTTQLTGTAVEDFEAIYAEAARDHARVPWARRRPHPALVNWLNAVAPSLVRCGARVAVVGCGLGDDARELMSRGYEVTAFDCSETAVEWAKEIDPGVADSFHVADLTDLPLRWRHRFDLVVEINTIQALPPDRREATCRHIKDLLSPHGYLLVICRGASEPVAPDDGPPWALTEDELAVVTTEAGLVVQGSVTTFLDNEVPPVMRMRGLYKRG